MGGLYAGRTQHYDEHGGAPFDVTPWRERRDFDGLGRVTSLSYRVMDVTGSNQPTHGAWGASYCHGSWSAACASPLYQQELRYDVMDRLTSTWRRFGHPLATAGGVLALSAHHRDWRGYGYTPRGFLNQEWESDAMSDVSLNSLFNHTVSASDLASVGYPQGSGVRWDYGRESGTGDLLSITRADNAQLKRWSHHSSLGARKPGHKLDQVSLGSQDPFNVGHDARQRVTYDGTYDYHFDAFDRLVYAVNRDDSGDFEAYVYDAQDRLIYVETPQRQEELVYDGAHKIASYQNGALVWEARWGGELDQLIEWRHNHPTQGSTSYIPLRDHRHNIVGLWNTQTRQFEGITDFSSQGRLTRREHDESIVCQEEDAVRCDLALDDAFPFGFNAAWRSPTTHLYQMRYRWYSPELGEFLSHDPLEHIDSFNMYAFALNDPINYWDPWGLKNKSVAPNSCGFFDFSCRKEERLRIIQNFGNTRFPTTNDTTNEANNTPIGEAVQIGNYMREDIDNQITQAREDITNSQKECEAEVACQFAHEILLDVFPEDMNDIYLAAALAPAGMASRPAAQAGKNVTKVAKKASKTPKTSQKPKTPKPTNPCAGNSFEGSTLVLMCDGSLVAIEELEEGDWVWGRDALSGEEGCFEVLQTWSHVEDNLLMELEVRDESGLTERYIVTPNHPMIRPDGSVVEVWQLQAGESIGAVHGGTVSVVAVKPLAQLMTVVHNLSVDGAHSYFVGDAGVWTHNADCPKKVKKKGLSGKEAASDVPSWAKGQAPYKGENGKDFAQRLLDERFGKGGWEGKGADSDYNKIKKWGDRAFEDPK